MALFTRLAVSWGDCAGSHTADGGPGEWVEVCEAPWGYSFYCILLARASHKARSVSWWKEQKGSGCEYREKWEFRDNFSINLSEQCNGGTGQTSRGPLEAKERPAKCPEQQPCFFHVLFCDLQVTSFLAPVSFLVQTPITHQWLFLPLFLFHHSNLFLSVNSDSPILLLRRPQQWLFTVCRDSRFPRLAWSPPWCDLSYTPCHLHSLPVMFYHVGMRVFPDRDSHFLSLSCCYSLSGECSLLMFLPFKILLVFFRKHLTIFPHIGSCFLPHQHLLLKLSNI